MNFLIPMVLIIPGLICVYAFWIRPLLAAMPQLKAFYAEADGFWGTVWAICGKSATLAWSYLLAGVGILVQFIDPLAAAFGDPDLHNQVTNALASDPKIGLFCDGCRGNHACFPIADDRKGFLMRDPDEWPERVMMVVMIVAAVGCVIWGLSIAIGG